MWEFYKTVYTVYTIQKGCCKLKAKVCVTLKSNLAVVRTTDSLDMITAVERDA